MTSATLEAVKDIVAETLGISARRSMLGANTALFGSMPELDSLAVVDLAMAIETRFDISIDDEDFSGELFETIGSLSAYVDKRTGGTASVIAAE